MEKNLRCRVDSLQKEKNERMTELNDLSKQDEELCVTLCATPYYIPTGSVPSRCQLQELQEHVEKLNKEKVRATTDHDRLPWMLLVCHMWSWLSLFVGGQGEGVLWSQRGHQVSDGGDGTWTREQPGKRVYLPRRWHFPAHAWQHQSPQAAS